VVVLGLVSLLNDGASEMVTPLLPVFLTATLGAGPAVVGLIEGAAEFVASVLKLISGWLTDRGWNPKRVVVGGYTLSNAARPLLGLALGWTWVLALRCLDRVGKGLRTAPRDALIAAATDAGVRGRAFGFHRSMDHLGAVIGPLLAFALLTAGLSTVQVFLWSGVIGAGVIGLLLFGLPAQESRPAAQSTPLQWRQLDRRLRRLLVAVGGLALATVPEAFLVLWATQSGTRVAMIPLLWAGASVVKMALALPAGILSDRIGRLAILISGWALRVAILLALAWLPANIVLVPVLFLAYAATLAITEPAERSLVGDIATAADRGTAFGWYHLMNGVFVLPGALLFGGLWQWKGSATAFAIASGVTLLAAAFMLISVRRRES
jgi:MFS family permease